MFFVEVVYLHFVLYFIIWLDSELFNFVSFLLLLGLWIVSSFKLFQLLLLWIFYYEYYEHSCTRFLANIGTFLCCLIPGVELYQGVCMCSFTFTRYCQTVFQNGASLHFYQQITRVPAVLHSQYYLVLLVFEKILPILMCVAWHHILDLICISLMIDEVEYPIVY